MGLPSSFLHLVPRNILNKLPKPADNQTAESGRQGILTTILNLLDVEEADLPLRFILVGGNVDIPRLTPVYQFLRCRF